MKMPGISIILFCCILIIGYIELVKGIDPVATLSLDNHVFSSASINGIQSILLL